MFSVISQQLSSDPFWNFSFLRTHKPNSGLRVAPLEGFCVLWSVCKIEEGTRRQNGSAAFRRVLQVALEKNIDIPP